MSRTVASLRGLAALLCLAAAVRLGGAAPAEAVTTAEADGGLRVSSGHLAATLSLTHPALLFLGVDSLGGGKTGQNVLADDSGPPARYEAARAVSAASARVSYHRAGPAAGPGGWSLEAAARGLRLSSRWSAGGAEPLVLTFDTHRCYSTLLGLFDERGDVPLPAVLHLPGFGTLRLTAEGTSPAALGYASGPGWIKVVVPAATEARPSVAYRWDVVTLFPLAPEIGSDRRFDGFRRNWLNIFQLNPNRRMLSNNTASDTCGFCYYEYADIARQTPALAGDLHALDIVRQTLDRVLAGTKTYGMPGYGAFPVATSDTAPSLLIAAADCCEGRPDKAWLQRNYPGLRAWAETMLATDRDGSGLIQYQASGDSGSWPEGPPKVRPSNWWDTIGFGHEDAYANALAYRALLGLSRLATDVEQPDDAARYGAAARKLHDTYYRTFLDPATGILGGWRSADGQLHDYAFLFVNSIAVLYGLVPPDQQAPIMDRLWRKMGQVGYTDFALGLPGNLVPVARKDYAHKDPRYGGGAREDNRDGFQVYENGGATACFAYFTIAALYRIGEGSRADRILFPLLDAFERRAFEGTGPNHRTNDWRMWDGTAEGYEGFLVDNYYAPLAVLNRGDPDLPGLE
jgi:hypothetical protein